MKINEAGLKLIKDFEGCSLSAYPDPGTGGEPFTIGYGHTGGVKPKDTITLEMAQALLLNDLAKFEKGVEKLLDVDVTINQFSALVSFAFNIGLKNLSTSTLLRRTNQKQWVLAASEFERWSRAAGKIMPGLMRRRRAERDLYLSSLHS